MLGVLAASSALAFCNPVPGAQQLWAQPATRYVLVGETHGTTETPRLFADLVCAAYASRRPIVVALEQPETEQAAIDGYLLSDGGPAARRRFLASALWHGPMADGRSSQAYFELFDRLRRLKMDGRIKTVVAFQPFEHTPRMNSETGYNAAMADRLRAAGALDRRGLVIALMGSVHASKRALKFGDTQVVPAAADLPPSVTLSLKTTTGGEAWNCATATTCGAHPNQGRRPQTRRVALNGLQAGYDGMIDLGAPSTASPPAAVAQGALKRNRAAP